MQNPELNATILALEIQKNYYEKLLDQSIRDNEVFAKTKKVLKDLKEVSGLFHFSSLQRWTTLILPGIFPYLITGLVTASGGAWNASIIAEYFHLRGQTLSTLGLGAQISRATDHGQFDVLLMATIIMALMVVTVNRLVWRPLFHLAETKYRLEG